MIYRSLTKVLEKTIEKMPIVTLTGPRQSGKTTLIKSCFQTFEYSNLEDLNNREFAISDPKGFLDNFNGNLIIDEIQQAPNLFSTLQTIVDSVSNTRKFVISGSQNYLLLEKVSQSLAGRTSIYNLLPFSLKELGNTIYDFKKSEDYIAKGFYPRIYDQDLNPTKWLEDYIVSYVERDVRTIINIGDLIQFQRFVRLCAGRIGQLINFSELGNEIGVSYHTIQKWLSVLETSHIIFRLPPWYENYNKRITKSSKLYFYDTGLAAFLLGIKKPEEVNFHFSGGALFENLIIVEILKTYYNQGIRPPIYFWRDSSGHEIDCLIDRGNEMIPIEIKMGKTISSDWFKGLLYFQKLNSKAKPDKSYLIYGGDEVQTRKNCKIMGWKLASSIIDDFVI